MKNLKRKTILILMLLFIGYLNASTITSTTAGGLWNISSTWVGGVVPTENDNVIINGPITTNGKK